MSTIDIGIAESPVIQPISVSNHTALKHRAPVAPALVSDGDFYVGSTKISSLPLTGETSSIHTA